MEEFEPVKNKEQKSVAIAVQFSLEFLTAFEFELRNNPDLSVSNFHKKFLDYKKWDQSESPPLINQGTLLAYLYGLLVYPWGALQEGFPAPESLSELAPEKWGKYTIHHLADGYCAENLKLQFFLSKIRNAISHSTVEITDEMSFVFKDVRIEKRAAIIEFDIHELIKFVQELYRVYLDDWNFEN